MSRDSIEFTSSSDSFRASIVAEICGGMVTDQRVVMSEFTKLIQEVGTLRLLVEELEIENTRLRSDLQSFRETVAKESRRSDVRGSSRRYGKRFQSKRRRILFKLVRMCFRSLPVGLQARIRKLDKIVRQSQ